MRFRALVGSLLARSFLAKGFSWDVASIQLDADSKVNRFAASGKKWESIDFFHSSFPKESS